MNEKGHCGNWFTRRGADESRKSGHMGIRLNPFILENPEAVFVHFTSADSKNCAQEIRSAAERLCFDLVVPCRNNGRVSPPIAVKPNWTLLPYIPEPGVEEAVGSHTDPRFVEGWLAGLQTLGCDRVHLIECSPIGFLRRLGYLDLAARYHALFEDGASKHVWELTEGEDFRFVDIPDGMVFDKIAYVTPVNEPEAFLLNIAKLKSHSMGITAAVKNLQGTIVGAFHRFCQVHKFAGRPEYFRYRPFLRKDLEKRILDLYQSRLRQGVPRWDKPEPNGGLWMEYWVQTTLDSLSVTRTGLNIVEGIFAQDGDGFGGGPHNGRSRTYAANVVLFGLDPLRVDMIAHWIAGHNPHNFGLFHAAVERGMLSTLDPADIPLFLWQNRVGSRIGLDAVPRTPLPTPYLTYNYGEGNEPDYHLCDEPLFRLNGCDRAMKAPSW